MLVTHVQLLKGRSWSDLRLAVRRVSEMYCPVCPERSQGGSNTMSIIRLFGSTSLSHFESPRHIAAVASLGNTERPVATPWVYVEKRPDAPLTLLQKRHIVAAEGTTILVEMRHTTSHESYPLFATSPVLFRTITNSSTQYGEFGYTDTMAPKGIVDVWCSSCYNDVTEFVIDFEGGCRIWCAECLPLIRGLRSRGVLAVIRYSRLFLAKEIPSGWGQTYAPGSPFQATSTITSSSTTTPAWRSV